jgi:cold shock CspA family protein
MRYGTVAWFGPRRGVSAMQPDGGDEAHLRVHYSKIDGGGRQRLQENDRVAFHVVDGASGRAKPQTCTSPDGVGGDLDPLDRLFPEPAIADHC